MNTLPKPPAQAIFYEDEKLYGCLASFPMTIGHTIVAWKQPVTDLHLLSRPDFEYLMDKVDQVRNALLKVLKLEKIYLMYMDEVKHVHWHLIPRYDEEGFNLLKHNPDELKDFSLSDELKKEF